MYFTTWTSELIQTDIWLAVRNRINPFHATDLFDTPWKHQKASASGMKCIKEFKELWKLSLFKRKPSITNDFLTITWYSIFQIFFIFVFFINLSASKIHDNNMGCIEPKACNLTKKKTTPWVFFTFFKLYKLYQIAQTKSNIFKGKSFTYQWLIYEDRRFKERVSEKEKTAWY